MVNRIPAAEPGAHTGSGDGSASDAADARRRYREAERPHDKDWHGLVRAWRTFGVRLPRLRVEASRYVAARVDLLKSKAARAAEGAMVGVVGAVVGIAVLATAGVLTIVGIAGALTSAFDGNAWAGNLVTGGGLLALVVAAVTIFIGRRRAARMKRLRERYAEFDRASSVPPGDLPPVPVDASPRANGVAS